MADSLLFDGVDDYINFTPGGIVGTGALTCMAIVKITSDTSSYRNFVGWNAVDAVFGLDNAASSHLAWYPVDGPALSTFTVTAADGWCVVGLSKPDGAAAVVKFHKFPYGGAWTHNTVSPGLAVELAACTRVIVGARGQLPGNFMNANILIAGWWDSELSDATIETLATGKQAWITADPVEAWRLDSTSAISSFSGTSTESARTGTTLDTGDAPSGWSDSTGIVVANSWQNGLTAVASTIPVTVSGFAAGDLLVLSGTAFANDTGIVFDTPTDNGGNTYGSPDAVTVHDGTYRAWAAIWSTVVVTPPTQVNVNVTGNSELGAVVIRVTGNATSSVLDDAEQARATADDPTSGSVTTTVADTILVANITQDAAGSYTSVASFTIQQEREASGWNDFAVATRIVSSTGTYSAAWTTGGSADYAMTLGAYKGVTTPVTGVPIAWIRA